MQHFATLHVESLRNKLNVTTLCMNARDLLHCAFHGELDMLDSLTLPRCDTSKSSKSSKTHVVFNLPELALDILCDEVHRAIPPHVQSGKIQEAEIHRENRARDETNEMKNAKKVRNVQESNEADDVRNMKCDMNGMGNITSVTISSSMARSEGNLSVYCYTFASSRSEVLEHLKLLLPHLPEVHTAKIRHVRLVSPSKAMFCVEFDLELKGGICVCECGNMNDNET